MKYILALFASLCLTIAAPAAQPSGSLWLPTDKTSRTVPADRFPLPKVQILGIDKPYPLGELVDISLSPVDPATPNLASTSVVWKVFDFEAGGGVVEKKIREYQDGSVSFGTGIKNKKMLVLASVTHLYIVKDGDKVGEVATRSQVLTGQIQIGEPPPPEPPPPPTPLPDGKFRLAKFAYDSAMSLVSPTSDRATGADVVAKALKSVVSATRNGTIKTNEEFLKQCKDATDKAFIQAKLSPTVWNQFGIALQNKLYSLYKDERKLNTVQDFADAIDEVVNGLQSFSTVYQG